MPQPELFTTLDLRIRKALLVFLCLVNLAALLVLFHYLRPVITFVLTVLSPFVVALIVAYIFNPMVTALQSRYRFKRIVAVLLVYTLIVLITVGFFAILVPILYGQLRAVVLQVSELVPRLWQQLSVWLQINIPPEELDRIRDVLLGRIDWNEVRSQAGPAFQYIGQSAGNVAAFVSRVFFTSFTSTLNQRGLSGVALASKYLFFGSNCVASG